MPQRTKHTQQGFTLQEMLFVIVISIILMSVSAVGILTYVRHLQLAELDNAAKEIFLAAQNRAILLSGSQRLEGLVVQSDNAIEHVDVIPGSEDTTQITVYYIHSDDTNIGDLLPQESIDAALWDGDFYITYEPESGSIVDVFFSDTNLDIAQDGDFPAFYTAWRGKPKEERMDRKPMCGYYGGESAQSGTTISLRTPVINIYNEDTLRAEVTYWVPRTLDMMADDGTVELDVQLHYQDTDLVLTLDEENKVEDPGTVYLAYTYTWILDSLQADEPQFQDLFESTTAASLTYGDDFTLSAEVSYIGDLKVNGARKTAENNSLFAAESGEETAYITCLRHLQNLDKAFSGVTGKTAAVQQLDIPKVEDYLFQPIENDELLSYDGAQFSILDLTIQTGDAFTGLFGAFSGTDSTRKTLENIRLVDTTASGSNAVVGALVGSGSYLNLTNCQVYWENQNEQSTNLRDMLGDSDKGFKYKLSGGTAGGLAGQLSNSTITRCSASTLVSGTNAAGGLIGSGAGLNISKSYSASYLKGSRSAGLVGNLTGSAAISGSYAVGFIDSGSAYAQAAGLCLGGTTATVTDSYSAMLFTVSNSVTNHPLCQNGTYTRTYYLDSDRFNFAGTNASCAKTYDTLTDSAQWTSLFAPNAFAAKSAVQSHPYNLQTTLSLTTFIYPGVAELDHWGDWGAQFQNGSLVYYEIYQDGSYGFTGGDINDLETDRLVKKDGYAVAYRGTDFTASIDVALSINYEIAAEQSKTVTRTYAETDMYKVPQVEDITHKRSDYYLLPLPDEVVNSTYTAANFYQKITIKNTKDLTEKSYYYSPHFANTMLRYEDNLDLAQQAKLLRVPVRSPRHLYMLSLYPAYSGSGNQYRFIQQLDLDYTVYEGYNLFPAGWSQSPIGTGTDSFFRCSYYGNCFTITGVQIATTDAQDRNYQYIGLFGYNTGLLQDIVYQMEKTNTISVRQSGISSAIRYVGGLAGYNGGSVNNCAVSGAKLSTSCFQYSTAYLGGLVGLNEGTIHSSAAEVADMTATTNLSNAYAGGFVGRNTAGGIIDQCYAVGKVSASRARYGTVYACGFSGRSDATIRRSYAAVALSVEGEALSFGFSADDTTDCVFLNKGNFTYRDAHYAAQYSDPSATPVTWDELSGAAQSAAVAALGMTQGADAPSSAEPYPYPSAVKIVTDTTSTPVHYGQWPDRMKLGLMGVYYWEKLTIDQTVSYHFSALSYGDNGQVDKISTLSTAHNDGGVVTEYGYGYFHGAYDQSTILTSSDIYWDTNLFQPAVASNTQANAELAKLMGEQYKFYSYDTWNTTENKGLHIVLSDAYQTSTQPPTGAWTLTRGNNTLTVRLNPFFADAMSYSSGGTAGTGVPTVLPGLSGNPYEVRSIDQLQLINWNTNLKATNRRMDDGNKVKYPYLSYSHYNTVYARTFYWEQTHDLKGAAGVTYTPVAEIYDSSNASEGNLFGWFGGSYNGNDYMIADVNIKGEAESSCVGLFGAVFNGTLKNIVLYSESGTATVEGDNSGSSRWYAIGGLAGLAGSDTGSSVENCTVSGYTIRDTHQSTTAGGWGGTGLGGLIGVSDMSLKNCTAVANIELKSRNNDHVRIGGLVGSCQGSISSCYSGGIITIAPTAAAIDMNGSSQKGMYIGGIVGGIYMKPLTVTWNSTVGHTGNDLTNTLQNCYTYTQLPSVSSNRYIKGLYAVGGSGELSTNLYDGNRDHGWTIYSNNFYLSSVVLQDNNGTINALRTDIKEKEVIAMDYTQMKDTTSANGLLQRLNAKAAGFKTVTTQSANGDPLSGRFSFGNDSSLLGKDYPFPTILTQSSDVAKGGIANVHYGNWPLEGIRRAEGALPVSLDLFDNYSDGGTVHTETLTLSGVSAGGSWTVDSNDPSVATCRIEADGNDRATLSITAKKAGSAFVTVTYTTTGNQTYTLQIEVNVTAELRLASIASSPVQVFTDTSLRTQLELRTQSGKRLPDDLIRQITLSNFTTEYDPDYFTQASVQQKDLTLTADTRTETGSTQLTVGYTFRYLQTDYPTTSILTMQIAKPAVTVSPVVFTFAENAVASQTTTYTGENSLKLQVDGQEQTVTDIRIIAFEEVTDLKHIVWAEWAKNEDGTNRIGTLSITASPQPIYPSTAVIKVQLQFECNGSTHSMWLELPIQLKAEEENAP